MNFFAKRHISLRITLFSAFLGTVLLTIALNAATSALHVSNLIKQSIQEKIHTAVGIGALQIDGDRHASIRQNGDDRSEEYQALFRQLENIRNINPDIKNVYTIRQKTDGGAVFIVDADPKIRERAAIGQRVIEITPAISEAFAAKNRIVIEDGYFTDEWGTFVSGFAPFYTASGTFEGLLGMDVMAETVQAHQLYNTLAILIPSVIVAVMAIFLSLILSREISNPIKAVTADMGAIRNFNLETASTSPSLIHEINEMSDALESMKKGLRSFKKYVPTELVADLIKLKKEASLEVESRHISILFSDIQGFTTISEQIAPEALAESIGIYFGEMTRAIMETGGIVDKFIGDAIMALWGTPHDLAEHPLMACKAALACRAREAAINKQFAEKGLPVFFTRIGINTGDALVGNIGFDRRLSYTAIGDSVNLAARLEGINKLYHTGIIISESTYAGVRDAMLARFIDVVIVKGKTQGVRIYELISTLVDAPDGEIKRVNDYNTAMELYIAKKWPEALKIFTSLKGNREDFTLDMMLERCKKFIAEPPGDNFVGVVALRDK